MLSIRLFRTGKKNQSFFKIVVTDRRNPPSGGRFVESLGYLNPLTKEKNLKGERIKYWLSVGAKPSDTVHNLLIEDKLIEGEKIPMHKVKKGKGESSEETKAPEASNVETKEEAPASEEKVEVKEEEAPAVDSKEESPALEKKPEEEVKKEEPSVKEDLKEESSTADTESVKEKPEDSGSEEKPETETEKKETPAEEETLKKDASKEKDEKPAEKEVTPES